MLTLEGPSLLIDGVLVFRDDLDPSTYYYVNDRPRIAEIETSSGEVQGALKLIHFAAASPTAPEGGVLFGDVDLGLPDAWFARAEARLRTQFQLTQVNLRPPDWESGRVRFVVLGESNQESEDEDSDQPSITDPTGKTFKVEVDAATSSSLTGDNRAMFQAQLDSHSVKLVRAVLENEAGIVPIGVIYDLAFHAKRPAFKVRIEAEWSTIFDRLEEKFELGIAIVSIEVENVVQELIDEKHFHIIVDISDPESEQIANQMAEELKVLVLEHFFEPMAKPTEAGDDTGNDILDFAKGLKQLHTGVVGWSRRELHAEMTMAFNASAEVSRTVVRRIFPQGHLVTLVSGAELSSSELVQEVNFDDYMARVRVDVRALVPWKDHRITQIEVQADYGDNETGFDIRPPLPNGDANTLNPAQREFVFLRDTALGDEVTYRWTVRFEDDAAGFATISSDDLTTSHGLITLDDNELYTWRDAVITVEPSTWDSFTSIVVELRVDDSTAPAARNRVVINPPADGETLSLASDNPVWSRVFAGIIHPELSGVATLRTPGGDEHVVDLLPRRDWKLEIANPLVDRLSVTCLVSGTEPGDTVLLEIDLLDPDQGLGDPTRIVFESTPHTDDPPQVQNTMESVPLNGLHFFERRVPAGWSGLYYWRQFIIGADGERIRTRWRPSRAREIEAGRSSAHKWPILVRIDGGTFERENIRAIRLQMWVEGDAQTRTQERTLSFESQADRRTVQIELDDPSRPEYRYQVEHNSTFGRRHLGPITTSDGTEIVVSSRFPN